MYTSSILVFALLIVAISSVPIHPTPSRQCRPPYFSVDAQQVVACYNERPSIANVTVTFADETEARFPSSKAKDNCIVFNLPVGHGYPVSAEVDGFDCTFGMEKKGLSQNCGWEYCANHHESTKQKTHHTYDCPTTVDEGVILAEMYYATGGASWARNDNWLTGTPCANNWFGVSCDQNNHVTYMDLRLNNLVSDQLPQSLGCLQFLKGLHFDSNFIKGSIPDSFCKLTNLIYLTLPNNFFSGSIPTCFSALINVQHLYLQNNRLTGELPDFSGYLGVKEIHVENNCLSGSIPQNLQPSEIIDLSFAHNNFAGCIPDKYQNKDIDYSGNNFCSGPLPCWLPPTSSSVGCGSQNRKDVTGSGICSTVNQCVSVLQP